MPSGALGALAMARSRRVDVGIISDSNGTQSGYGWLYGFAYGLSKKYTPYASRLISVCENNNNGATSELNMRLSGSSLATTGGPAALHNYLPASSGLAPNMGGYLDTTTTTLPGMVGVPGYWPKWMNNKAALRQWLCYGTMTTGSGAFQLSARLEYSPFTLITSGTSTPVNTGVNEVAWASLDIASGASRTGNLGFRIMPYGGTLTGPFFGFYHRVEDPSVTAGFSVSLVRGVGGDSAYDMAAAFNAAPDDCIWLILNELRRLQVAAGQTPVVVLVINSGVNDRTETLQPSLGPVPSSDADSPEAYVDNIKAIISRVESIYSTRCGPLSELYWLILPSHPVASTDDTELVAYRAAAADAFTGNRYSVVDLSEIMDYDEAVKYSWYVAGPDVNHISAQGHRAIMSRFVTKYLS